MEGRVVDRHDVADVHAAGFEVGQTAPASLIAADGAVEGGGAPELHERGRDIGAHSPRELADVGRRRLAVLSGQLGQAHHDVDTDVGEAEQLRRSRSEK